MLLYGALTHIFAHPPDVKCFQKQPYSQPFDLMVKTTLLQQILQIKRF